MTELSTQMAGRARKAVASVLRSLAPAGAQAKLAAALDVSESTISRLKTDHMQEVILTLYHQGFKVVPSDHQCVPEVQLRAWFDSHKREIARLEATTPWQDEA